MDSKMLDRIRALLAKAESTEFEAEAETFTAKAMELMAQYGIEHAHLAASGGVADEIGQTRITIGNPYSPEKALLLQEIAKVMRCRTMARRATANTTPYSTLFGYRSDMERVELLYTSLLLQASSQVTRQRPTVSSNGYRPSVTAYRRAWLQGFTESVAERLRDAERRATQQSNPHSGPSTALVLADRSTMVDRLFREAFPHCRPNAPRRVDARGYHSGRDAGHRADLGSTRIGERRQAIR